MALPAFDDHGNLPPGRHEASVDDVRTALVDPFVDSHTRRAIFDWWTELREALCELGGLVEHWLAGSFASEKDQPNDLDLVTVLDGPTFDDLPRHRRRLLQVAVAGHVTEELWRCDNYPLLVYPDDHAGAVPARAVQTLWTHHFGTDRNGNERGLVVVSA